jgi:hypothetical protein
MDSQDTPIDGMSEGRPPAATVGVRMRLEERLLWPVGDAFGAVAAGLRGLFERITWPLQRRLIWPLQDRAMDLYAPRGALAVGALLAVAAAAGVGGLLWMSSNGSSGSAAGTAVAVRPAAKVAVRPAPRPPAPTLHGVPPVFKPPPGHGAAKVAPAKQHAAPPAASAATAAEGAAAPAATAAIASSPSAQAASVPTPQAGPKALAVARKFSGAFVVYETGGREGTVRRAFTDTATPELTRALLKRPPRLPAGVKVPKAKVVNVVAGPSNGRVYTVSVSLLRVGVTSELRLEMERLKHDGWQVTNVLG